MNETVTVRFFDRRPPLAIFSVDAPQPALPDRTVTVSFGGAAESPCIPKSKEPD